MDIDWRTGYFTSIDAAKEYIYADAETFKLGAYKKILDIISSNEKAFDAFLGKTDPLAISFYYSDGDEQNFDPSEFFLVIEKFDLTFIEGLWNRNDNFNYKLALSVFMKKFPKTEPEKA